jgi:hypothetical protein
MLLAQQEIPEHADCLGSVVPTQMNIADGHSPAGSYKLAPWPQIDVDRIIAEVDKDGDGRICYSEFCDMLRNQPEPAALSHLAQAYSQ